MDVADTVPSLTGGLLFRSGFTLAGLCSGGGFGTALFDRVVDLRTASEREDVPLLVAPGMAVSAPLDVGRISEFLGTNPLADDYSSLYRAMAERGRDALAAAVSTILEGLPGPVRVGCSLGKDRTGVVVSVLLAALGVPRHQVVGQYLAGAQLALRCGDALRRYADMSGLPLTEVSRRCRIGSEPILALLASLDEDWGGAEQYLFDAGVAARLLDAGRSHLLRFRRG
jgi:protein-tyrosine phosphatase